MKAREYAAQTQNLCQRWDEVSVFAFADAFAEHLIARIAEANEGRRLALNKVAPLEQRIAQLTGGK